MIERRYQSTESLDGVIDLERLRSGPADSLERSAQRFFELTYLSEDLHKVLKGLSRRFKEGTGAGTVLAQAVKGLGKSHTLLLGYHLFKSLPEAKAWTAKAGYDWTPPENPEIIVHKFTDQSMPGDALWLLIGQRFKTKWSGEHAPDLDDFRTAIKDCHLILIVDELEQGIAIIPDPTRRSQNIAFLQMLSEEAGRDGSHLTLFAAVYDSNKEPGSTFKRTHAKNIELHFRKPQDRAAIVRHRLFKNADSYDKEAARSLIQSYINTWRRFGMAVPDGYVGRMEESFPFLPDLIELVFERITESGGFQGTRSALGLLGAMLDATPEGSYLMTASNCRVTDPVCADRLSDLDPGGSLINPAAGNYRDLAAQPYAEAIASAVLLASLVPGGRAVGVTTDELVRHVVRPGDDPNQYHAGLEAFRRYGTYFHEREGRFLFDLVENEYAKVEFDAMKLNDDIARDQVIQIWLQEVFRDSHQSVIYRDPEETKLALQGFQKHGQRYVLAPRRLSQAERFALYQGLELRNQVLLLEPRDPRVDHLTNFDFLALAKRLKAARQLAASSTNTERRLKFERIADDQGKQIQRNLKSAGLLYIRIDRWSDQASQAQFEEEGLGQASSKEDVRRQLIEQVYPQSLIEEHLRRNLPAFIGKRVDEVERFYRTTLGFPVPLLATMITEAIRALVADSNRILGMQYGGKSFCGESVNFREPDLMQAVLAHPWPESADHDSKTAPAGYPATAPVTTTEQPAETEEGAGVQPSSTPAVTVEERSTPSCRSLGELRQQTAARLTDMDDPVIRTVRFTIFADYRGQDLSGLPAAYRGALSGSGDVGVQLDIMVPGPMTKAGLEQHCEKLPNLSGASYMARFSVEISKES